ncbi:hypothetical protein BHU16_11230 [Tannerella sp. oral taxon 808]|nr:hypothetical protein BHU16_11230 [Tannerella sp. oral taxon 808]
MKKAPPNMDSMGPFLVYALWLRQPSLHLPGVAGQQHVAQGVGLLLSLHLGDLLVDGLLVGWANRVWTKKRARNLWPFGFDWRLSSGITDFSASTGV